MRKKRHTSGRKRTPKRTPKKPSQNYKFPAKQCKKQPNLYLQRLADYPNYEKITENLMELAQTYPDNIQVESIGESKGGRPIFLVYISRVADDFPKSAIFIEAGSDGEDLVAVSCALYIINYLCVNADSCDTLKVMECFIMPCINPDDYELKLFGGKPKKSLAKNFPFKLGLCDVNDICRKTFMDAVAKWKENYDFNSPETRVVLTAVSAYKFAIKLFISLQEEGEKIVYPFGMAKQNPVDVAELKRVANIGNNLGFPIGSIYDLCGLTFGTIIDCLRIFSSLQFVYIIHVNNKKKVKRSFGIAERATGVLDCITLMGKEVSGNFRIDIKEDDVTVRSTRLLKREDIGKFSS